MGGFWVFHLSLWVFSDVYCVTKWVHYFVSQVMGAMQDRVEDNAAVEELEQWRANARAFLSGCAVEENQHTMKKHRTASFHFLRALDHALLGCCGRGIGGFSCHPLWQ